MPRHRSGNKVGGQTDRRVGTEANTRRRPGGQASRSDSTGRRDTVRERKLNKNGAIDKHTEQNRGWSTLSNQTVAGT